LDGAVEDAVIVWFENSFLIVIDQANHSLLFDSLHDVVNGSQERHNAMIFARVILDIQGIDCDWMYASDR